MERFPRGSLPPAAFAAFAAVATSAPVAVARAITEPVAAPPVGDGAAAAPVCDLTTTCPTCMVEMQPEHAHYKCPSCGYRDSCCF